jgi:hypothetical protein
MFTDLRRSIIICCLVEKNGRRPIEAATAATIAGHFRVPLKPVLMALG